MGAGPSVTFTLVQATPYTLRYLCDDTGQPGTTELGNAAAIAPSTRAMLADALTAAGQGAGGLPLAEILRTTVASQAEARHLMLGDAGGINGTGPVIASLYRCRVIITPRNVIAGATWAVDADLGTGGNAGVATLVITPPNDATAFAYLDIHLEHTIDDGFDSVI